MTKKIEHLSNHFASNKSFAIYVHFNLRINYVWGISKINLYILIKCLE